MSILSFVPLLAALLLAPFLLGVINRVKAFFAGRSGPPLLQAYYDLSKLLRKGAVYSRTTGPVFRAGPVISLAAAVVAVALVPLGGIAAPLSFTGDFILVAYLLGLGRFVTVLAALDTGSAFEGMGASREVTFSALAEPILLLGLVVLARQTGELSLSSIFPAVSTASWTVLIEQPAVVLVLAALGVVLLAENARLPVDDPNTHLELTMIHEVMVLDHGGPDLAFIEYGAALKLWLMAALLCGMVVPPTSIPGLGLVFAFIALVLIAAAVGVVESVMARLRLLRVPQLLVGAGALSVVALIVVLR